MKLIAKPVVPLIAIAAVVAGCSPITLAPTGAYAVSKAYSVPLDRPWNDITALRPNLTNKVRLLTLDGPALNSLYLTVGLAPGDTLLRTPRKESRVPVYADEMSVSDQIEFVEQNVTALGYNRVATNAPRPVTLGGHRGVRFDISGQTDSGLDIRGIGQALKRDGKLYVSIYLAPAEHYYEANLSSAEHTMNAY